MSENRLTAKQEKFVEDYISNGGNATQAAGDAGYRHPNKRGPENVVKSGIRERIAARTAEAKIHTDEVIGTLASHMRADIGEIMPDNPVVKRAKEAGVSHWIKRLTIKEYWDKSKGAVVQETSVELHSSQAAAKQLCSIMGLDTAPQKNPYDLARAAYERLVLEHPGVERVVIAERVGRVYGVDARLLYE
jgi:hypothetical protein